MTTIAFNYCDFKDAKKKKRQSVAIDVIKQLPKDFVPVAFCFKGENFNLDGITTLNLLKRNSRKEIGNDRDLPYVKEIMDLCANVECEKIGYINSDILIDNRFVDCIRNDHEAFILSRFDITEVDANDFYRGVHRIIYGGDQHLGVDGFFFKKSWWIENSKHFPDDLILGETEWDTCWRHIIRKKCNDILEQRVLYHVYHDIKWTLTSKGAKNNIKIWKEISS